MVGLIVVFVLALAMAIAASFGCWWAIKWALIAIAVAGTWMMARAIYRKLPTRRRIGVWWRRNRREILATSLITGTIVALVFALWCAKDLLPACEGGCWSTSRSAVTVTAPTAASRVELLVIAPTGGEWSEEVTIPLFQELDAAANDRTARWMAIDASGREFYFPTPKGEQTKTPPSGYMRFRSLESYPVPIQVTLS